MTKNFVYLLACILALIVIALVMSPARNKIEEQVAHPSASPSNGLVSAPAPAASITPPAATPPASPPTDQGAIPAPYATPTPAGTVPPAASDGTPAPAIVPPTEGR